MTGPWTPGPWVAKKGAGWFVTRPDAEKRREAAIMVGMHAASSLVGTPTYPEDDAEAEANAHLIAAAPEMAETLEALLNGCEWKEAHTFSDGTTIPGGWSTKRMPSDKILTQARALLSRIRGETP